MQADPTLNWQSILINNAYLLTLAQFYIIIYTGHWSDSDVPDP